VDEILSKNHLSDADISHYLFHQATWKMLDQLRHRMQVEEARLPIELADIGNTVSCTIPILIQRMRDQKRLTPNAVNMLVGFGVGLSWAGCLWKDQYLSRSID
jgi:3-oxoacyl-[acyl-carrier-protein] synthase-3